MPTINNKKQSFQPPWWLGHRHLQTTWAAFFRHHLPLPIVYEEIELPDGDFVELAWLDQPSQALVLLVPGFHGSVNTHYARGMMRRYFQQGWSVVFMHFRGGGRRPNRFVRSNHFADSEDLKAVIDKLHHRYPKKSLAVVGISMGGNKLLHCFADYQDLPVVAGVAISVPFEPDKTVAYLNKGMSKVYQRWLLGAARRYIKRKFNHMVSPVDLKQLKSIRNFYDFDQTITVPLNDLGSLECYYEKINIRKNLSKITTPTLIVHAEDDPFVPSDSLPTEDELSDHIIFDLQKKGGHIGFVTNKSLIRTCYWAEERSIEFLQPYLDQI